jgi:hypothetical protein
MVPLWHHCLSVAQSQEYAIMAPSWRTRNDETEKSQLITTRYVTSTIVAQLWTWMILAHQRKPPREPRHERTWCRCQRASRGNTGVQGSHAPFPSFARSSTEGLIRSCGVTKAVRLGGKRAALAAQQNTAEGKSSAVGWWVDSWSQSSREATGGIRWSWGGGARPSGRGFRTPGPSPGGGRIAARRPHG